MEGGLECRVNGVEGGLECRVNGGGIGMSGEWG